MGLVFVSHLVTYDEGTLEDDGETGGAKLGEADDVGALNFHELPWANQCTRMQTKGTIGTLTSTQTSRAAQHRRRGGGQANRQQR
jgi:hypothetical protein